MAHILIIYGSTDGHTGKVADTMATSLRSVGHNVSVHRGDTLPPDINLADFDGYIVGASVHYGKFQKHIGRFISKNLDLLKTKPSAFFAVSGASSSGAQGRLEAATFSDPFLKGLGWAPARVEQVAGAFPFRSYSWWKRLMMQYIVRRAGGEAHARKDYAYTDWDLVQRFALEFSASLAR